LADEGLTIANEHDYCIRCGCPRDVCCGKNSVSLERLEKEIEKLLREPEPKRISGVGGEHSAFVLGFDTAMERLKKRLLEEKKEAKHSNTKKV